MSRVEAFPRLGTDLSTDCTDSVELLWTRERVRWDEALLNAHAKSRRFTFRCLKCRTYLLCGADQHQDSPGKTVSDNWQPGKTSARRKPEKGCIREKGCSEQLTSRIPRCSTRRKRSCVRPEHPSWRTGESRRPLDLGQTRLNPLSWSPGRAAGVSTEPSAPVGYTRSWSSDGDAIPSSPPRATALPAPSSMLVAKNTCNSASCRKTGWPRRARTKAAHRQHICSIGIWN